MDEQSIFLEALEKPSPEAQCAWLDEACGEDESLKRRIKKMLQMQEHAGSFLEQPAQGVEDTEVPDASPSDRAASLDTGLALSFDGEAAVVIGDASHSVLRSLGNTLNDVPRVALRESADEGADPIERPGSSEIPKHDFNTRYQLQGEIARGGMGAIIKGRDTDLGRDLAIKVLLDSHKDKPEVIQRFIEEAQIGGQLQHPGIAPIYELGQFSDKRPFFAMKLVKGQTLSKLLADREDAADERGNLIGIFEQICQTMAYAHSRGVIHRDLKPANIMVGAFGEVQVMDWGLAKVLAAGGVADEKKAHDTQQGQSIIQTLRSQPGSDIPGTFGTVGSQTQMGSVMGTPAYMPPEQALGEIDNMDERADVFGLGAILTEILTGKPPYVATKKMDVFRQASRGKLDDCMQRLDSCGADGDLSALTKHCLNLEPTDRPRDAGVLADQVKGYLESVDTRLRLAELDRIEATTRVAEERKRRKVTMALAASVMLASGIAGGGWVWMKQKDAALAQASAEAQITAQVRRGQLEQQIAGELSTARTLASVEPGKLPNQSSLDRATAAIDRAENLLHTGDVHDAIETDVLDLKLEFDQMGRDRKLIAALEDCWQLEIENRIASREKEKVTSRPSIAKSSLGDDQAQLAMELSEDMELEKSLAKPAQAYAAAFLAWGVVPTETTHEEMAQRLSRLPESVRASVLVSLDRWRAQLTTDKTLTQWQAAKWSILQPSKLTSRGRDKLEVLDDQSILASGEYAHMGYDLNFETDVTDLSGMRLEALTHDSLPNRGPGRSALATNYPTAIGIFSLSGLEVWYAPRNAPSQRQRLWFSSSVADYSFGGATDSPLTTETWQIDSGAGEDHVAFFTPRDAPHCEEGFIVTISHEDRRKGIWGDQNIGRFRWSVNSNEAEKTTIAWLAQAAAENDDDAWRRELRLENQRGDLASLIHRARDTDSFVDQPRIVLAQLAEDLLSNSSASLLSMVEDSGNWTRFSADQIDVGSSKVPGPYFEPTDAVVVETQNDGSYVVSGETFTAEQLTLTGSVSNIPYAIKLELIPHPSDEGATFGRGPGGWVELVDVNAELVDDVEAKTKSHLAISQVMSDLPTDRPLRHNDITDNNWRTFCPCYDGENRHAIVFMCAPPVEPITSGQEPTYLRLRIRTGDAHRHLARFRLSVLNRPVEVPNPAVVALDLMRHVQSQDPNDFWTNIAASEMCLRQPIPLFTEALRYATAAVSIRPSDVGGHVYILGALPIDETTLDSPYGIMAKIHANRLWELDPENSAITKLKLSLGRTAAKLVITGEKEEAISKFKLAAILPVANDLSTLMRIGESLRVLGEYDSAFEAYQRVIDINPEQPWVYNSFGNAYRKFGDFANAEKMYRKEIELRPDDAGIAYSNLAYHVAKQDLDEAIKLCRRGIQSTPTDVRLHQHLGRYLRQHGDLDGAAIVYREALEKDQANPTLLVALAEVLVEFDQHGEAIKLREQALELSAELSTEESPAQLNILAQMLLSGDETSRDHKRAIVLAEKAVEIDPSTPGLLNTLGYAYYCDGNWRQAVETLNKSTEMYPRNSFDAFFLAMAHWQLDEKDKARSWFRKGVEWMAGHNSNDADLIRFRAEAEKTLGIHTEPVESK